MFSDYEKVAVELEVHREETEPEGEKGTAIDVDVINVEANEPANDVIDEEANEPANDVIDEEANEPANDVIDDEANEPANEQIVQAAQPIVIAPNPDWCKRIYYQY